MHFSFFFFSFHCLHLTFSVNGTLEWFRSLNPSSSQLFYIWFFYCSFPPVLRGICNSIHCTLICTLIDQCLILRVATCVLSFCVFLSFSGLLLCPSCLCVWMSDVVCIHASVPEVYLSVSNQQHRLVFLSLTVICSLLPVYTSAIAWANCLVACL